MSLDTRPPEELYLELLKKSLVNLLYLENEARLFYVFLSIISNTPIDDRTIRDIEKDNHPILELLREKRQEGQDQFMWQYTDPKSGKPALVNLRNLTEVAHTMIGCRRLDNIHHCLDIIRTENISGDLMETGVWRGGAVLFMRGYLAAYGITDKTVWAADSFEGLPIPSMPQDSGYNLSKDVQPILAISLEEVQNLFSKYNLLDDKVRFLKGWFKESLPRASVKQLALLRLDGDLYESTRDAFLNLYHKVVPGGFIIVDDYGCLLPCRKATDDFREQNNITEPLEEIDHSGVFWRKRK
jgi:hypothetical protein